jgi:hypothetical protein
LELKAVTLVFVIRELELEEEDEGPLLTATELEELEELEEEEEVVVEDLLGKVA